MTSSTLPGQKGREAISSLPSARSEIHSIKPYVPGKPISEVKRELGLTDIIKLASNENPLGPSPLALEALERAIREVHLYPDGAAYELKNRLAARHGVGSDQIVLGAGSDEVMRLLAEAYFDRGHEVIVADPTFSQYEFVARIMGASVIRVPTVNHTLDLLAMAARVTPRTKAIFVCNPNNPTGTAVGDSEVKALLESVPENVLVVLDEAYHEYVTRPDYPDGVRYLDNHPNVVVLRTFSKIFGLAGLRVGYGVMHPAVAESLERVRPPFNVNLPAQAAALAALDDEEHLARSREVNEAGKAQLYSGFAGMGLEYVPTQANFVLVRPGVPAREAFTRLLSMGIIIRPGDSFGLPEWIRVTVGTPEQNLRFLEGLLRVVGSAA